MRTAAYCYTSAYFYIEVAFHSRKRFHFGPRGCILDVCVTLCCWTRIPARTRSPQWPDTQIAVQFCSQYWFLVLLTKKQLCTMTSTISYAAVWSCFPHLHCAFHIPFHYIPCCDEINRRFNVDNLKFVREHWSNTCQLLPGISQWEQVTHPGPHSFAFGNLLECEHLSTHCLLHRLDCTPVGA